MFLYMSLIENRIKISLIESTIIRGWICWILTYNESRKYVSDNSLRVRLGPYLVIFWLLGYNSENHSNDQLLKLFSRV